MGQQLDNIQEQLKMQYDKSQANEHRLNQRINNLIQSAVPPLQVTVHNHPDRNFLCPQSGPLTVGRKLSHRNSYEKKIPSVELPHDDQSDKINLTDQANHV